jgi:choline/glycine/proline betaine transport protein
MQVNAGLSFLFDVEVSTSVQILLIAFITGMATISVVAGLDAGIRRLSKLNLLLAMIMLIFILVAGPTATLLGALVQNIGGYLSSMVDISGPNEKWTTDITYVWTAEGWLSLAVVMDLNARRIVD